MTGSEPKLRTPITTPNFIRKKNSCKQSKQPTGVLAIVRDSYSAQLPPKTWSLRVSLNSSTDILIIPNERPCTSAIIMRSFLSDVSK